jgi:hypothetical protein
MRIIDYIYDYSIEIEKALWEIGDGDLRRRPLVLPSYDRNIIYYF